MKHEAISRQLSGVIDNFRRGKSSFTRVPASEKSSAATLIDLRIILDKTYTKNTQVSAAVATA